MKLYLRYFLLCALFYVATSGIRGLAAQELGYTDSHSWMSEFAASSVTRRWHGEIKVNQTTGVGPIDTATLEYGIRRGLLSWSRSDAPARYTGTTADESGRTGSVTVVWVAPLEMFLMTGKTTVGGSTRSWYNLDTGDMVGATIYLNEDSFKNGLDACAQYIINHELGHSFSVRGHSSDRHDLMFSNITPGCRYAVTLNDVVLSGYNTRCHIELMDDGGIYIPEIAGQGAYLKSTGDNVWHLEQLSPVDGECNTATVDSMLTVRLSQIRGYGLNYTWADLVHIGDDNWQLIGGE